MRYIYDLLVTLLPPKWGIGNARYLIVESIYFQLKKNLPSA